MDVIGPFKPGNIGELPLDCLPNVDASDLLCYLVLQTSFITAKQFKVRKRLEAYNQFVSGWVKDVSPKHPGCKKRSSQELKKVKRPG